MRRFTLALLALTILITACGGGAVGDETTTTTQPVTTTVPETTTTTTTPPAGDAVIDWDDPAMTFTLSDGWSVAHCEGEAPFLCVSKDGEVVGVIERFIADPYTYEVYDPAAADETNLRAIAAEFIQTFQTDRASGCGSEYVLEPIEPAVISLGGNPGLVYGFTGTLADGTPSEHNLQFATLSHGRLIFLVAAGYDEGGCLGKDDTISFDSATLDAFRPHLAALLEASPLPGGDPETGLALPDGHLFAWILSVEDGLIVDPARVLSGEEARLQATADGVIPEGEDLPNDIYLHNLTEEQLKVRVADDVVWRVIAPGTDGALATRDTDQATIAAILAGGDPGDIYGLTPKFMPFDLLVINGEVVEITERYLP